MIDDTFLLLIDLLSRKQQMLQIFFCSRFFANTFFVSPTFDVGDKGGEKKLKIRV